MNSSQLFEIALGLTSPWYIERIEFTESGSNTRQLEIYLKYKKGVRFKDSHGKECSVYDSLERRWQHLHFFEHRCYLHASVPRIRTSDGKVEQIQVPWARAQSGFTLLFEAYSMLLIENEMPVNKAAGMLRIYPQRLWTIFNYWIRRAHHKDDQSQVTALGIDETSSKRGHDYITLGVDLDQKRVLYACEGKNEQTVVNLKNHLTEKGVKSDQIKYVSMDMSPAFISGVSQNFPKASIVFDRFHVIKLLNEAVDKVRMQEARIHKAVKGHKYTFLKHNRNLTATKLHAKYELMDAYPALGEVVRLRELFNDYWEFKDVKQASAFLSYWCDIAQDSRIQPILKFVNTLKAHWSGIINYIKRKISNGILEGINSKIQLAKRRARGYRNKTNLINMIYFIAGKLEFDYPHYFT